MATLYALGDMLVGNGVAAVTLALGYEIYQTLSLLVHPLVAEAGMGGVIGLGVGSLMGGVIAHQQRAVVPEPPIR